VLKELHIRDLGVIAEAFVPLGPGLNVFTGETGVGKTMIVTSLALLTGARGHTRLVRAGASEAVVQGVVGIPAGLDAWLSESGVDAAEELVVVRRLGADGRTRAWIGGQLSPVASLAEMGERIVEMHGQGAGFALARPSTQLAAIDTLAGNEDLLGSFRDALHRLRILEKERRSLRAEESTRERELELLTHQVGEIDRAALTPDEDDRLHAALTKLEHAERLGAIGASVLALVGPEGAAGALAEAHKILQTAAAIDADAAELITCLGDVAAETSELAREIRSWNQTLEADPAQLESLRERKALIATLKRKYGATVEDVLAAAEHARGRLAELAESGERSAAIDSAMQTANGETVAFAQELTKSRARAAKRLTKLVCSELPALALRGAKFKVTCASSEVTETGADRVDFRFSSSGSTPDEPIGKVASGGELSRAMIAVTLALARAHEVPVLVFDEADQGLGGEAALELGRRLARLGRSHQVLVVSHLPQIAAFADRHIAVRRRNDDIEVEVLDEKGRLAEVSRMLAGLSSSKSARAHASELLDLARSEKQVAREPERAEAVAPTG
jgi:DNA repair protein RecN (Recombination protein N)